MINLHRGFRRLLVVLSVVWAGGSGFYLWRLPAASSSWRDAPLIKPSSAPWRDDPVILPTASPGPSPKVYLDENGNPKPATTEYLSTDPNAGVPVKANATPTRRRLRAWFEIGLIPPLVVFALLEGLLWAARGFSENKQTG